MPVIFLPGVMASFPFWTPALVEPFLPYGRCSVLTLPGHYPAAFPPEFNASSFTPGWMAELLHTAVRQMVGDLPVLLVGHSTGGFAALDLASQYPRSVRGVISIAGFAQGRWSGWLRIFQHLANHPILGLLSFRLLRKVGSNRMLFGLMAAYHTPIPGSQISLTDRKNLIDANHQAFCRYDPRSMQIYFEAMSRIDILGDLHKIEAPVLLIHGDADPAVPTVQSKRIASAVPHAELAIIAGGVGHMPF